MTAPRVSVVLPVYNPGHYLNTAVDSILNQTYRDFELIAIDDGSSDGSSAILEEYARSDIRMRVIHQQNKGLVPTLNSGLQLATGEYIARMDADDISDLTRFEKQVAFLDAHPEIAVVGTQMRIMSPAGTQIGVSRSPLSPLLVRWTMLLYSAIAHPTVMVRRERILHYGGYEPEYAHAEDYALWTRMAINERLANLPEVLFTYRWSDTNVSTKYRATQLDNSALIAQRYTKLLLGIDVTLEQAALVTAPVAGSGPTDLSTDELERIVGQVIRLFQIFWRQFSPKGTDARNLRNAVGDYLYPLAAVAVVREPITGLRMGLSVLRVSRNPREVTWHWAAKVKRRIVR